MKTPTIQNIVDHGIHFLNRTAINRRFDHAFEELVTFRAALYRGEATEEAFSELCSQHGLVVPQ